MVCPIQVREDRLKSKTLEFSCDLCSFQEATKGDITKSPFCRNQVLQILPFIEANMPCKFNANNLLISIPASSMSILREYASMISEFENQIQKTYDRYPDLKLKLFLDPIEAYKFLQSVYTSTKNRAIREFISSLERTKLISQWKEQNLNNHSLDQQYFYEVVLKAKKTPITNLEYNDFNNEFSLLSSYDVGPFNIQIYETPRFPLEKFYRAILSVDEILLPQILTSPYTKQKESLSTNDTALQSLAKVMESKITDYQHYLQTHFHEVDEIERNNLAIYATAQTLNFTKTIPLLLDDHVQEVYLDKPGNTYYLDHARWGRCRSNLQPSNSELSHLITRLRLESRRALDERTPSLKTELKTSFFHVRAAIDVPPLAHEGPHLNIRKIRMKILTLPELIENGTISLSAAAFLVLCMTLRINITINGEPSTGKTTLANAVNLLAPPSWRRIAIEDALESVSVDEGRRHKVTFRVDSFDSPEKTLSTKSNEIIRLLHRSPDWVFLGEIQTAEHSEAMFHALSAGIKGIQTCHASSNNDMLLRWKIHHKIPDVCFQNLGLLVHMVREVVQGNIIRRVVQIGEMQFQAHNPSIFPLFEWNKASMQLEKKIDYILTPLVLQACKYKHLTEQDVRNHFHTYKETLVKLTSNHENDPIKIVSAFDDAHAHVFSTTPNKVKPQKNKEPDGDDSIKLHQIPS